PRQPDEAISNARRSVPDADISRRRARLDPDVARELGDDGPAQGRSGAGDTEDGAAHEADARRGRRDGLEHDLDLVTGDVGSSRGTGANDSRMRRRDADPARAGA